MSLNSNNNYHPGTRLPINGWIHPCSVCKVITSKSFEGIPMCNNCLKRKIPRKTEITKKKETDKNIFNPLILEENIRILSETNIDDSNAIIQNTTVIDDKEVIENKEVIDDKEVIENKTNIELIQEFINTSIKNLFQK